MSLTLTNNTRRMKVFNLPHNTYCKALGHCACTLVPGRQEKRICTSLTMPAGTTTENLPKAVLFVAEISRAVKVGDIAVKPIAKKADRPRKPKATFGSKPEPQEAKHKTKKGLSNE